MKIAVTISSRVVLFAGLNFISIISLGLPVQSISTFGNAQNNTLTSQHGGFEFSRGDSS